MSYSILVAGGAGLMGSELTRALLHDPDIDRVTIGELDVSKAKVLADELDDPRVSVAAMDVRDPSSSVELARGHDLLMNCTFFGLFSDVLAVACAAGVPYADLLSTPEDRHHEMVDEAGITAISGLGATPGMTNILGRLGCEEFDVPDTVEIAWSSFRPLAHSPGLLGGMFWEMGPECETRQFFRNGRFVQAGAFEGSKTVDFGYPIGRQATYFMAHTETVALPRHFPSLAFVCVRGTWRPAQMQILRQLGELGLMDFVSQESEAGQVEVAQFVMDRIWSIHGGETDDETWGFHLVVEVSGRKGEVHGTKRFRITHPTGWREHATARMTGIPAAVQVSMALRKGPSRAGIVDATEYFTDPLTFLDRLQERETISVETEWVEDSR